jgi:hypothetical protein
LRDDAKASEVVEETPESRGNLEEVEEDPEEGGDAKLNSEILQENSSVLAGDECRGLSKGETNDSDEEIEGVLLESSKNLEQWSHLESFCLSIAEGENSESEMLRTSILLLSS